MPRILALDTATSACSAALLIDNVIIERYEVKPQQHTKLILPMLEDLLAEAGIKPPQLDAIAFGCGPGSFTGLRIAAGVVQGVAFALDLPVIPVSTLLGLAQTAYRLKGWQHVITAIDARMDEVYWGSFKFGPNKLMVENQPEQLYRIEQIPIVDSDLWYGAGDGWAIYHERINPQLTAHLTDIATDILPHAQDIALLAKAAFQQGKFVSAEQAIPVYLRDNMYTKRT